MPGADEAADGEGQAGRSPETVDKGNMRHVGVFRAWGCCRDVYTPNPKCWERASEDEFLGERERQISKLKTLKNKLTVRAEAGGEEKQVGMETTSQAGGGFIFSASEAGPRATSAHQHPGSPLNSPPDTLLSCCIYPLLYFFFFSF